METVLISYFIGFAVAWFSGAAPADLPETSLTSDEKEEVVQLKEDIQEDPEDVDSLTRLGQIYFFHNRVDEAGEAFDKAKALEPEEGEIIGWWGSNRTKQGGLTVPWAWGIRKIFITKEGVAALNQAIKLDPENPIIRLLRINTFVGLEGKFSDFEVIFREDETFFTALSEEDINDIPDDIMAGVYLGLAKAYTYQASEAENESEKKSSQKRATDYLDKAEQRSNSIQEQAKEIREQIQEQ